MGNIKKINNKGFTLIELLAVIVILAILMLLALPAVLNIMENARKDAFRSEAMSVIKAAQTKYASDSFSGGHASSCYTIDQLNLENSQGKKGYVKMTFDTTDKSRVTYQISFTNGSYSIKNINSNEIKDVTLAEGENGVSNTCPTS